MREMKFGIYMDTGNLDTARAMTIAAENQGYYSVSTNDHFYSPLGPPDTPQLECFTALTAVACATSRIRLTPAITSISFRNPALLAKIISTLDIASAGRFICALGAGWFDKEYTAHGYHFPPLTERLEQLEETILVLKAMFNDAVPTFKGKHFSIEGAYNNPRPVQAKMPFMIGGSGTGLLKIAARHADIVNLIPPTSHGADLVNDLTAAPKFTMETLKSRIAKLHGFMHEIGRDPAEVEIGGIGFVAMSKEKGSPVIRQVARMIGFEDYEEAQGAPVALLGTPEEIRAALRQRIAETGMSYYILMMAPGETQEMFAREVLPEFSGVAIEPVVMADRG